MPMFAPFFCLAMFVVFHVTKIDVLVPGQQKEKAGRRVFMMGT